MGMAVKKEKKKDKKKKQTKKKGLDDQLDYEELTLDDALDLIERKVNATTARTENILEAFIGNGTKPIDRDDGKKVGIDNSIIRTLNTLDELEAATRELENKVCRVE